MRHWLTHQRPQQAGADHPRWARPTDRLRVLTALPQRAGAGRDPACRERGWWWAQGQTHFRDRQSQVRAVRTPVTAGQHRKRRCWNLRAFTKSAWRARRCCGLGGLAAAMGGQPGAGRGTSGAFAAWVGVRCSVVVGRRLPRAPVCAMIGGPERPVWFLASLGAGLSLASSAARRTVSGAQGERRGREESRHMLTPETLRGAAGFTKE
jgi:hypothetical protein